MLPHSFLSILAFIFSCSQVIAFGSPESASKKVESVTVQAFADQSAIVPGETFNVAVSLKLDEGWHVYWQSPGPGTGLPTELKWKLPTGLEAGSTRYPVPEAKDSKELEETSYVLNGSPILIAPIRADANLKAGEDALVKVEVSWLACKTKCIPGSAEVSFKMPVVAKGVKAEPANEALFKRANSAMPQPKERAQHLKLSGSVEPLSLKPGGTAVATLIAEIAPKHHMQSHKPHQEELIAAYLFMEQSPGLEVGEVSYPEPHDRNVDGLGKLSEYSGKIELKVPITVDKGVGKDGRWIRGVFQYQICNDAGTCYPPQQIEWSVPVQMEGGGAPGASANEFRSASPVTPSQAPKTNGDVAERIEKGVSTNEPEAHQGLLTRIENVFLGFGFVGVILLAMIGGLVLNFMPCVLPVISLKILSYVRQSKEDRKRIFFLGLSYCSGIMTFFTLLAFLYFETGEGWGQHFQSPHVVLILAALVTAFALSLFGVFAVFTPKVINELGQKAEGEGAGSAFATGVLATVLGTACTAPALSAAIGAASKFPPAQGAIIFVAVGVGMAAPFFLLSAQPGWLRFVPKPGPWMGTFEAVMGFLLLGTVVWLLNPLRDQIGDFGLLLSLIFLIFVSAAAWMKGRIQFGDSPIRKARLWIMIVLLVVAGWCFPFRAISSITELRRETSEQRKLINDGKLYALLGSSGKDGVPEWKPDWSKGITWLAFNEDLIKRFVDAGYTVFVDYTASWFANCKTNLHTSIDVDATRKLLRELNVVTFAADYTNSDPEIEASLKKYSKGGVPLYLVYRGGDVGRPQVLPEILSPGIVADALRRAGPSRPGQSQLNTGQPKSASTASR